jgi:hypothetical protein
MAKKDCTNGKTPKTSPAAPKPARPKPKVKIPGPRGGKKGGK